MTDVGNFIGERQLNNQLLGLHVGAKYVSVHLSYRTPEIIALASVSCIVSPTRQPKWAIFFIQRPQVPTALLQLQISSHSCVFLPLLRDVSNIISLSGITAIDGVALFVPRVSSTVSTSFLVSGRPV